MKCRTGKFKYKIPPISRIEQVWIEGNQKHNQMYSIAIAHISIKELIRQKFDVCGMPTVCAINHMDNTINFWPPPDKPYIIKIRFAPAIMEI